MAKHRGHNARLSFGGVDLGEVTDVRVTVMTEQQWLASTDVAAMLEHLRKWDAPVPGQPGMDRPRISDRKRRLFAVACCRSVWDKLVDDVPCRSCGGNGLHYPTYKGSPGRPPSRIGPPIPCGHCSGTGRINRSRLAVEVAERYADGLATRVEIITACDQAQECRHSWWPGGAADEATAACWCATESATDAAKGVLRYVKQPAAQADLLRHIVGNPFDGRLRVRWGECHEHFPGAAPRAVEFPAAVIALAQSLYAGDQGAAGILGDALYDAGQPELGDHFLGLTPCPTGCKKVGDTYMIAGKPCPSCYGSNGQVTAPHPRGCWALDLILGKE